jgi:hypothetical protein
LLTKVFEIDMRKIFIFLVFLTDCATQLSRCLSDPPLFVKLQGAPARAYCETETKACRRHNAPSATEAAAELIRRKAEYVEFSSAF